MSENNLDVTNETPRSSKNDKIEVVRILILAVVSFVLGFGLVIFFLAPSGSSDLSVQPVEPEIVPSTLSKTEDVEKTKPVAVLTEEPPSSGYAPSSELSNNPLLSDNIKTDEPSISDEASALPEVPPGKTPEGISLDGSAFYLKCWDSNGTETPGTSCDKLTVFEKRIATRLYVVDSCKRKHSGEKNSGKFSLGIEVDFEKSALSFWNGASSTIENADKTAACLRNELAGLPIHGIESKFSKYRIFFTVLFGDAKVADSKKPSAEAKSDSTEAKSPSGGKTVTVIKDNVRVRKAPVDGEIIGKIAKDNKVRLLKTKGDWCQIVTPNNNEGWMICDSLSK